MPDPPLHNPHDRFFKETLGRKEAATEFFREFLPSDLVEALDWGALVRVESSFVDETLRERHSDLLFTIPGKGRKFFLYCLFEHQRGFDRWMAFRLLRYMTNIWEEQLRTDSRRRKLSPILPIVLHQSEQRWLGSVHFRALVDLPAEMEGVLEGHVPGFWFRLVDLADWPMEELRGAAAAGAILAMMKLATRGDLVERLPEVARILSRLLRQGDAGLVRVCLEYLMRGSGDIDLHRFRDSLRQLTNAEIKEDAMTIADQLIEEGRQEGRQEEGRSILRRLLSHRFGSLPDWATERIATASTAELERWSERLLDAPDVAAVFATDP